MKTEKRKIFVNGKFHSFKTVRICPICGGHEPCTSKTADYECVGHIGVK